MMRCRLALCMIAAALPGNEALASLGGNPSSDAIPWLRLILGLILCVGLAFAAALFLRTRSGVTPPSRWARGMPRRLRLLETVRVGPQTSLSLVMVDSAEYLLLSTPNTAQLTAYQPTIGADEGVSR